MSRLISTIAREIAADWKNVNYGAQPYLIAMFSLDGINDKYGLSDAREIIIYFLANASGWRGAVAKEIKAELKAMIKA